MKKQKIVSLIPALWASLFDTIITILYQPKEYWQGNLDKANEENPIGKFIMQYHVSGLFIVCFIWIITLCLLGYYLPKKLSQIFLLFILIVHSWGASSWILMNFGFWYVIGFILFNSILFYKIEEYKNKFTH